MTNFNVKYPTIAKMLHSYLTFTKRRNNIHCRIKNTVQKVFDWKIYSQMNHNDMEQFLIILSDFPFFDSLSEADKMTLFKRFWMPFSLLERIYDSLNNLNSTKFLDGNFIILQNGSIFELDGLNKSSNLAELEKITFNSWKTLLPLMKTLNPHCIEVMYIFCCILWNSSYLDIPLTEAGDEIVRRGRLVIHKEMREFYNYDEIQWERIYALRHILVVTEDCIKEPGKDIV
uniref:NR LBD domain-containing protein n=1 Tax=Panagrolaimus davidi TaxID=227884 RepID=A0A914P5F5_9BILA